MSRSSGGAAASSNSTSHSKAGAAQAPSGGTDKAEIVAFQELVRIQKDYHLFVKVMSEQTMDGQKHWPWLLEQVVDPVRVRPVNMGMPSDYDARNYRFSVPGGFSKINKKHKRGEQKGAGWEYTKKTPFSGPICASGNDTLNPQNNRVGMLVNVKDTHHKDDQMYDCNIASRLKPHLVCTKKMTINLKEYTKHSVSLFKLQKMAQMGEYEKASLVQTEALLKVSRRSVKGIMVINGNNIWDRVEAQARQAMVREYINKEVPIVLQQPLLSQDARRPFDATEYSLDQQWEDVVYMAHHREGRIYIEPSIESDPVWGACKVLGSINRQDYFNRLRLYHFSKLSSEQIKAPFETFQCPLVGMDIIRCLIKKLTDEEAPIEASQDLLEHLLSGFFFC